MFREAGQLLVRQARPADLGGRPEDAERVGLDASLAAVPLAALRVGQRLALAEEGDPVRFEVGRQNEAFVWFGEQRARGAAGGEE